MARATTRRWKVGSVIARKIEQADFKVARVLFHAQRAEAEILASLVYRGLDHPRFRTKAQRLEIVARAHHDGVAYWQCNQNTLRCVVWPES